MRVVQLLVVAFGGLAVVVLSPSTNLQQRWTALAQMPKGIIEPPRKMGRGMLQGGNEIGLGYDLRDGKSAQAAEDPFNHKPLLKADPKHPGKVLLTKDAIERRKAYKEFIKRHPRVFNPPSDIKSLDAAQDPQPSPTHDSGAYHLTEAGIKV
mmetsp:Transcript_16238/g.25987  ORF Transcript_16238/g.25987 Transcript_16238/m.25987 type:complete len:152 (-) Transcript_16238:468-923(-)